MTNKEKLFEDINPHTRYWDCYKDEPLEYDHTGKVIKICKNFTVLFVEWIKDNCIETPMGWQINGREYTTEELMKIYLNRERYESK